MKDEGAARASKPTGSASSPQRRRVPRPGEPAAWFHAATEANPNFSFDTVAGHRVVLSFLGGMSPRLLRSLLLQVRGQRPQLDRSVCVFFGVTPAADDTHARLFKQLLPWGYRFLTTIWRWAACMAWRRSPGRSTRRPALCWTSDCASSLLCRGRRMPGGMGHK